MFPSAIVFAGTELTPLQRRTVFRLVGFDRQPPDDTVLAADAVFGVWLFMLVIRLRYLEPDQQNLLAEEVVGTLSALGDGLQLGLPQQSTPTLVIADGRYATWNGRTGWLDLVTGESVAKPAVPPLETMGYNLAVLFDRNKAACEAIQRRNQSNAAEDS